MADALFPKEIQDKANDVLDQMSKAIARESRPDLKNPKDFSSLKNGFVNASYKAALMGPLTEKLEEQYTALGKDDKKMSAYLDQVKRYADDSLVYENAKRRGEDTKEVEARLKKMQEEKNPGALLYQEMKKTADEKLSPKKEGADISPSAGKTQLGYLSPSTMGQASGSVRQV